VNGDQAVEAAAACLVVCCTLDGGDTADVYNRAHAAIDAAFDRVFAVAEAQARQADLDHHADEQAATNDRDLFPYTTDES
jgi:hypothetical protein